MTISENITHDIQQILESTTPPLTKEQIERRDKILNSDNPKFIGYGHKISEIEKIVKEIYKKYKCSYEDATIVFKNLVSSNIHEEKFAGIFFLNHFKSNFNQATLEKEIAKGAEGDLLTTIIIATTSIIGGIAVAAAAVVFLRKRKRIIEVI